ncbi:MAG: hypothetical protein JW737_04025 [Acidobacteria bacterium]|nr:hypothetical protein [Acidobacteriota bacterium]
MKTCIVILISSLFLSFALLQASYAFPDGYEPDNNHPQAGSISNGPAQQHTIYPIGDEDWVKFTLPREAGVVIETSGTAGDTRMWLYKATTPIEYTVYYNNFDTNPGWSTQGQWAFGQPTGGGGTDPVNGFTGANVYGYNLNGDYPNNLSSTEYLTTTAIDCRGYSSVTLKFERWLGVETSTYDHASIEVSNDGYNWLIVWQNPDSTIIDNTWMLQQFDISSVADNQPTVYIRWGMGTTDSSVTYCGWNIDDVQLTGIAPSLEFIEYDDDSGIDYFSYIDRVCGVDTLPAGTYYVQIDEYGDDQEIVDYTIQLTVTPCVQRTIYVDDDAANDPGPGSPYVSDPLEDGTTDHPYDAIQEGIDASLDGDRVIVKDGTYTGDGNHDIDFAHGLGWYTRNIRVQSENGPKNTIINCQNNLTAFNLHTDESINSIISGFTITGATKAGIYTSYNRPQIKNCIIKDNNVWHYPGLGVAGIYCHSSAPTITDCIIFNNSAYNLSHNFTGGVVFDMCLPEVPLMSNCIIYRNNGNETAGGVVCFNSSPFIENCVIMDNYSINNGGGLYLEQYSSPTIINCTIIENKASLNGGGIYATDHSYPVITNTILWNDFPNEIQGDSGNSAILQYCDISGGWPGLGSNNINKDPGLIPFGLLPREITLIYFRIGAGSPCIDAGTSINTPVIDIDGKSRNDDPMTFNTGGGPDSFFDIGAYEFKAFYVATNGNDSWDGRIPQWNGGSGPKKTIQAGLDVAGDGEQVIVAPGTYTGNGNRDLQFSSKDMHLLSEKGPLQTIIDCQASSINGHNGIMFYYETPKAVVKGFTIKNGYLESYSGGGIACSYSHPTILDCRIENCSAVYGGGIAMWWSNPLIANCIINNNHGLPNAWNHGDGGGIYVYYGSPYIKNCLITNNTGGRDGGGISSYGDAPVISNCTIYGNSTIDPQGGGGMYLGYSIQTPKVINCIVWNNTPDSARMFTWATPVATYSDIQGGTGMPWFGVGCIDISPDFAIGSLHNFYLSQTAAGQSTNSPCVDTGESSSEFYGLNRYTTRTDGMPDADYVDMGYHAKYALRIDNIWRSSGNVVIHWNAIPGVSYYVEWSTDMIVWNEISVGAVTQWTDTNTAGYTMKLYRVRER